MEKAVHYVKKGDWWPTTTHKTHMHFDWDGAVLASGGDNCSLFGWLVRIVVGSWRSTAGWFVWEKNTVSTENLRSFTTSHSQTNRLKFVHFFFWYKFSWYRLAFTSQIIWSSSLILKDTRAPLYPLCDALLSLVSPSSSRWFPEANGVVLQ